MTKELTERDRRNLADAEAKRARKNAKRLRDAKRLTPAKSNEEGK